MHRDIASIVIVGAWRALQRRNVTDIVWMGLFNGRQCILASCILQLLGRYRDLLNGKYLNWLFLRLQFRIEHCVRAKCIWRISAKEHVCSSRIATSAPSSITNSNWLRNRKRDFVYLLKAPSALLDFLFILFHSGATVSHFSIHQITPNNCWKSNYARVWARDPRTNPNSKMMKRKIIQMPFIINFSLFAYKKKEKNVRSILRRK